MSSASFAVTYTSVYTNSEPGRVFWEADEELSDGDYIPGTEEPQTPPVPQDEDERVPMFIQPHDLDYMPGPMYPEYIPLKDEHVFPAEEHPLPPVVSPTAESPRYVAGSDPEEDPEEYEDDKSEDGPVDYPMDRGDNGDDDDGDSSEDDADDEDEDEEDEEEEEHLALAYSTVVVHASELASISLLPDAEVERLLAMPTLPPSPLTSLSPPSRGERLARLAFAQALIDAVTAALPLPPLRPLPLPLYIPPPVDRRDDIPKTKMPPRKRSCLFALGFRYEIGKSSTAGPTGDSAEAILEIAPMTLGEVNTRVIELAELHEHDTYDLYALLEDAQDSRTRVCTRVSAPCTPDTATAAGYSYSDTTPEILSDGRHEKREIGDMQAELLALREQPRRARQPGLDARVPDYHDVSRDSDSNI
uniref:Uncharacterized protein n=1 Tax=Tanacetum cinerariifolium TaxID=118510 RepID=A0A6L2NVK3_TANCI|nr:hypothetical protein [Tanacetum cinerariifolium]